MAQTQRTDQEVDSAYVQRLKRKAKLMAKANRLSHSFTLEQIAKQEGYRSWNDLRTKNPNPNLPRQEPDVKTREPAVGVMRRQAATRGRADEFTTPEPRKIPVSYKRPKRKYTIVDLRKVPDEKVPHHVREFGNEDFQDDLDFKDTMPFHGSQD